MGDVRTNNFSLAYAIEQSRGVLPGSPSWKQVEPNGDITFGANTTKVSREPISKDRQRRKGTITDLDADVSYEADLTVDSALDFIEGFVFAVAKNADLVFQGANAVGTSDDYDVPSLSAAQVAKLHFNAGETSLLFARGYSNSANNGLRTLNVQPIATDTDLQVGETLVTETAPTNALIEIAGIRSLTNSDLTITRSAGSPDTATVVSAADLNFTTYGLTVGQFVHIGGIAAANQPNNLVGYGRITAISATTLTLDKLHGGLATGSSPETPAKNIDILFGRFIRNVPVDDADYLDRTFQFEGAFPNLNETEPPTPVANPNGYEYAIGQTCNTLAFGLPLTSKATLTPAFIGTDVEPPVDDASRKTNAATPVLPVQTEAFNTSSDIARLRITQVDETGLTTDFKSITLTLNNNATPEKVLARLGAKSVNTGTFAVDIETQVLFSSAAVIAAIRNNTTVTMDFRIKNNDGAMYVDIPAMTLGGGGREFPVNETIRANITAEAHSEAPFNTSLGVSLFPVVP